MGNWATILKGLLNISDKPDKKDKVVESMPTLIQDLYTDMRAAEESVTLSMANVGQRRMRLKSVLKTLDQKKAETKTLIENGEEELAQAYYHSDVLPLESEVEHLMGQIETLDAQTAEELERFRDFEIKAVEAKDKLREAEQIERFAKVTERMAETNTSYQNSSGAFAKIDAHIEKIEFRAAKATAKMALHNHGEVQTDPKAREARALIAESKNSGKFLSFKSEMKSITDGDMTSTSTSDKAKKLLAAPAFNGALHKKGRV